MKSLRVPDGHRQLQLPQDTPHDPYRDRVKLRSPSVCSDCRAVYLAGRWRWADPPPRASPVTCPACLRKLDGAPAGTLEIDGPFYAPHRDEIMGVVLALEKRVRTEHALSRIMKIETPEGRALVHTTDCHLARQIGEALHKAYHGQLHQHYSDSEARLSVKWTR